MMPADKIHHDHTERWDESDIEALIRFRHLGLTYRECSQRLGRTVPAIRSAIYRFRNSGRWVEVRR
jgi:DNA-directed RNA polymerase specialized sigma24 family protein